MAAAMTDTIDKADLYEADTHAWAMDQADRLRGLARRDPGLAGLDFPHLIEELDAMAGADRRRVESLAEAIIQHLLLLEHSPAREPRRRWKAEIIDPRRGLARTFTRTLERHLTEQLDAVFDDARDAIRRKMEVYDELEAAARLPTARPYTLEQIRGDWWPPD